VAVNLKNTVEGTKHQYKFSWDVIPMTRTPINVNIFQLIKFRILNFQELGTEQLAGKIFKGKLYECDDFFTNFFLCKIFTFDRNICVFRI
jgi:hypothetical protein